MKKINTKNYFKAVSSIIKKKVTGKRIPLRAIFKVTKRCNLKCRHCLEWKFQEKDLPLEKIKYILDKLAAAGTIHLSVNGGEPLIRKDIGEIVRYAKKLGMGVGITTNGTFVPSKINDLKSIDALGLSLDGPKQIHDYLRGKGQFDQVMQALKISKENNIKNIYLTTVLTKKICKNPRYIDEIVSIAKRNNVKCNFVTMYGDVREGFIKKPARQDLKRILKKIINLKKNGAPILFSKFTYQYILDWPDLSKEKYYKGERPTLLKPIECMANKLSIAIEANGDIYPCNMVKEEIKPINIFKSDRKISVLMEELDKRNKCKYCYYGCYIEANALLNLNPYIIFEYLIGS